MDPFGVFKVSASALEAQRMRMNVLASNMANAQSTKTENGRPYVRKDVLFSSMLLKADTSEGLEGVKVVDVVEDKTPPVVLYDPGHPDADENGYVTMPNINVIEEMTNMMMALRVY
ncbi:MAG: flagellar basal body rod protein FlgC, partial [Nitrospirae bacterium]|nr:flagellar basal body rod protein FlgC [Nitrospirota bacterium]